MLTTALVQLMLALTPQAPREPAGALEAPLPAPAKVPEAPPPAETGTDSPVPEPPTVTTPATDVVAPVRPAPAPAARIDEPLGEAAPRPADLPLPRYRGTGLFVSGGILGAAWVALKIVSTADDADLAGRIDRGEYDPSICVESCYIGTDFNAISLPVLLASAGLLGGGMDVYGRWLAHRDVQRGVPHDLRRTRLHTRLGWGLIGGGLGLFTALRIATVADTSERGAVAMRELAWWLGGSGLVSGAMLAGHGRGYRVGRRKAEARVRAQVVPVVSRHFMGLGASGRF